MIRNYFKIAWRNLLENKLFSAINIISLAIGLCASFVIGLIVYYDFTFDTFHSGGDRIYRITSNFKSLEKDFYNSGAPIPLGTSLKSTITNIDVTSSFFTMSPASIKIVNTNQKYEYLEKTIYADENYFDLFEYQWLAGTPEKALAAPYEVILTKNRAKKYFPTLNPEQIVGQSLIYNDTIPATVMGVVANYAKRSDLIFEEFISVKTFESSGMASIGLDNGWNNTNSASQLFVKLHENASVTDTQEQLDKLAKEHEDKRLAEFGMKRKFYLQPLNDLHFNSDYGIFNDSISPASKPVLLSLGCVALFLLLLGSINFINLNTAQATKRAKEIGIRKTFGVSKNQLVFQFLIESLLLTVVAAILSLLFSSWLFHIFSDIIPNDVGFELFANLEILIYILLLILIVAFLSGFYPALVLTRFRPVLVLKNQLLPSNNKSSFRKYLTTFQFVIAQIFVIATILVSKQVNFLINKDMGFKTEAVAYVRTWSNTSIDKRLRFMNEIEALPEIRDISLGGNPPASNSTISDVVTCFNGQKEIHTELQLLYGDQNYRDVYDIQLLAGRERLNDSIKEYIINESCSKVLGFENPEDAIGQVLLLNQEQAPIVGVMSDFNQRSLKSKIEPMALVGSWHRQTFHTIHFSFQDQNMKSWSDAISKVENIWKGIYPSTTFKLNFMDDTVQQFYQEERKTSLLLNWAMGLSVLISCLGLLGLVIHTTERRTKEIGIRKVLGASIMRLNLLICTEFISLLGIAFVIAAPIAWLGLNKWLEDFSYRTDLSWWVFMLSGIVMLIIALLIMSVRTFSIVNANPINSLKTE